MSRQILFDLTCYSGYFFKPTPSGIGRIDMAIGAALMARHGEHLTGVRLGPGGPKFTSAGTLARLHEAVGRHWSAEPRNDVALALRQWLIEGGAVRRLAPQASGRSSRIGAAVKAVRHWPRKAPAFRPAAEAAYISVGYAMLAQPRFFAWLRQRPDIRPVFLVHDLIGMDYPEYFRAEEEAVFAREMRTVLEHARHVITPSEAVADRFRHFARSQDRPDLPVNALRFPVASEFLGGVAYDAALAEVPYFVLCGTIEPRKNHLLVLNIWRELAQAGGVVPKLVVVGKRGWENEQVIDMLTRSHSLAGHVIEVSGLQTEGLKTIIAHARAVLMPSFAEGFGLPVIEAEALGVPVVASDIPVFREVAGAGARLIAPTDGPGWHRAIVALAAASPAARRPSGQTTWGWADYIERFEDLALR